MMTCQELTEFLMAYLDDELPESERVVFEEHMGMCLPCVAYIESYKEAVELGKAVCKADADDLPDDVPENLITAILASRSSS